MPSAPRSFLIGETVHLGVRVSAPGTRKPTDASVTLTSLKRGPTAVMPEVSAFTRREEGDYTLALPTAALSAGTYDLVVTVADGPSAVVILPDQFVLKAA